MDSTNRGHELLKKARLFLAKKRPDELFKGTFHDMNEALKNVKEQYSIEAKKKVEKKFKKILSDNKVEVLSLIIKMGKFKGHPYISSAKLAVKQESEEDAKNLLSFLQRKVSSKYKFKGFKDGVAKYNIR